MLTTHKRSLTILALLLFIKALWACYEISTGYISLNPDEAQYWTWSRYMDFGYYSKPPGIAWQIWLGCKLFGQNELGVRFFSVVFSMLTALGIYLLGFVSGGSSRLCFWSALILAISPIGLMGTFAATTDVGFIFFWTLSLAPILWALYRNQSPNYYWVGCFILCGSFFKWPIYLLWPLIFFASLFHRPLLNRSFFVAAATSLVGLAPSIVWNAKHEWATFKHVFTQSVGKTAYSNFWDFFGAQFGVLSPIFFLMLLLSVASLIKRRKEVTKPLIFCAYITFATLGAFLFLSTQKKIQANWALYAYPSATLLIAWYALDVLKNGSKWLKSGSSVSLFMISFCVFIPYIQKNALFLEKLTPYKINPFRHSMGWGHLKTRLSEIPFDPKENFFFSDSYQLSSLLSFYGPTQKRQYFLNLSSKRKNQFSFWPQMKDEQLGKTGYYVWADNSKNFLGDVDYKRKKAEELLTPYFDQVEFVEIIPLFTAHNKLVKGALLFKCTGYNGKVPAESSSY